MQEVSHIIWKVLSEYISAKEQETAAHHLVNELIDYGIDEEDLYAMSKGNPILRKVVTEHVEIEEELDYDDDEEL